MTIRKKISTRIIATITAFVVMFLCMENLVAYGAQSTLQCYDTIGEIKNSPLGTHSILKMKLDSSPIYGMCIQPNTTAMSGNIYDDTYANDYYRLTLSPEQRDGIGYIMHYGYPVNTSDAYFCATQLLAWELVSGYRTFNLNNTSTFATTGCNLTDYYVPKSGGPSKASVVSAYNTIVKKLANHQTVPTGAYIRSIDAQDNPIQLTWNNAKKRYEKTLSVDMSLWNDCGLTGKVTSVFISQKEGTLKVDTSVSGKVTVYCNSYFSGVKATTAGMKASTNETVFEGVSVWSNLSVKPENKGQAIARGAYSDPVYAYMAFEIAEGNYTFSKLYQTQTGRNVIASSANNPELNENARFKLFKLKDGTSDYRLKENWLKVNFTGTNGTYTFSSMVASNAGSPMKLDANGKINNFLFMKQNKRYAEEI